MLAHAQLQGVDLFDRVVAAAAGEARAVLGDRLALTSGDAVRIQSMPCATPLKFEAWCVRRGDCSATIAAFATLRDCDGHERIFASGRFTFSIQPNERVPSA